jgi:predicted ATPase
MIKRFRVQNYKALRDVTLDLTPIHVLIGPNDSGKTSILEAIAALCRSVDHGLSEAFAGSWQGRSLVWRADSQLPVSLTATGEHDHETFDYTLACQFAAGGRGASVASEIMEFASRTEAIDLGFTGHGGSRVQQWGVHRQVGTATADLAAQAAFETLAGVHTYCWNPRFLGLPTAPDSKRQYRMEPSGFGLALCLDDILGYDRDRFMALEKRFAEIFPQIKSIMLKPEPAYRSPVDAPEQIDMLSRADGKGLHFKFAENGQEVSASQVSDGVLLVLAYLTIFYLPKPPRVLLVEEPENGIHPKRLQDVLKILRDLVEEQSHTQVILTTHSPYVLDMFKPEEVSVCIREKDGSVTVHKLSDSKTVREQLDVFTLGEIWTAEGDEAIARSTSSDEEPSE